ncbi:DUF5931 domain-containing protein [Streptomyces sp. XM4193]|uniref:MacS family sensor histidine kinase n=1 Tax=Streptomyces sp. XM4193 TaxID=2929782 RepID=UPI001FF7BF91|nr:DUF5931 domain-containing protein [Streptomyces sp. XM4193]MCK1796327.1 DUF5931 domain-containing protein [Streptomyces sp. XM4193]
MEAPLWRALVGYRLLTTAYATGVFLYHHDTYGRPLVGAVYLTVLVCWTLATLRHVSSAERCTPCFLGCDFALGVGGILLTPVADTAGSVNPSLPTIWVAGPVLALAIKHGWRWAAGASLVVGAANVVEEGGLTRDTVHNVLLVTVASIGIGYVVEVARASEHTLAEALKVEAATRERERLARDIHDNVLQVLAMVQRRGTEIGGGAAEIGRLAGEQEVALRSLVSSGPTASAPAGDAGGGGPAYGSGTGTGGEVTRDLAELLAARAGTAVTFAGPGGPVALPEHTARMTDAAVAAALDNVRQHAGESAKAWILLEDEPDAVLVTVRDDGPGVAAGRLAAAEREGRMGVSLSIVGRLHEVGGTAEVVSIPGQGTEVELRVPK